MPGFSPKISVIIPVYNSAPYLRRCLDSVRGQTLRDIEIICVNDGSTDDSAEILRGYASQDTRIRLIEFEENKGVSIARNTGMDEASGEYLGFVDSDDYVDLYFFEKLYSKASQTGTYIVKGNIQWRMKDGEIKADSIHNMVLQDKMDFTDGFFTGIYHTSFVRNNGIIFPLNITNGEDLAFLAKAVSLAPSVETVGDVIYNYCRRSNSADTEIYNSKQLHSVFKAYENAVLFINEHDISETVISKIYARYIESSCYLWNRVKDEDKKMSLVDAAAFAIRLYKLCPNKNALNEQLINQNMTSWIGFLEIGNIEYFADYLSQHSTRKQKIFTDLRLRVLRANPKHAFRPTQWLFFGYCFWEIMFLHI